MHTLILAALLLLLKASTLHAEGFTPVGAGIIAASCKDDVSLYLLAREVDFEREGWGHLGGTLIGNEPLIATALREFNEESNCVYRLDDPRRLKMSGPSRSDRFTTYHMMVPYLPINVIAESEICHTEERDQWLWVRRTDLLAALRTPARSPVVLVAEGDRKIVQLWHEAATALRRAVADKIIPEREPCAY